GVDVLDVDRALLDTGAAGGAGPEDVGVDDRAAAGDGRVALRGPHQRALRLPQRGERYAVRQPLPDPLLAVLAGHQPGGLGVVVLTQVEDQHLRRQRLVRVPRRALLLTATALGAGREVQQALPGEV